MHSGLGGFETLNLYAEAIAKMPENPGIPLLFRNIFKNAYLPYRDPETLKMFLKVIDEFSYDHSERLGDAFEYLLSVLGSQGDAGQFRTPRHIIDFMVEVVDPKKNETCLDPACGTAGFLISSYKHILRANTDAKGNSTLTPDEKGRLAQNFRGYDISPDMVRLSLVNMYLHGFTDPHIYEYDTLTSQDRWNDYADVILANPPFMSPKGGIKPHNRFSVQSKRSEVLFVDYMAEHLTPGGRAGIIVPEGIIFQSQTAYRDLRKMLVDTALVAVVSLPAGVFQPYSGVKTSILILDKSLAKKADAIAFFKVENDGFGLGAQRREIDKNDLPETARLLREWMNHGIHGTHGKTEKDLSGSSSVSSVCSVVGNCLIVPKEKIAANGDYNLSGERYREGAGSVSAWPLVPVGNVFCKAEESVLPESLQNAVTYIGLENLTQDTGEITGNVVAERPAEIKSLKNAFKPGDLLYGKLRPNLNKVWVADRKGICSTDIFVIRPIEGRAIPALYGYIFRSARFNDAVLTQLKGAQLPRIGWSSFAELQIPLPPLEVQQEIVAEIEGYQKVIDGARAVLDNYRPHIPIHPDWPTSSIDAVASLRTGTTPDTTRADYYVGDINFVKTSEINNNIINGSLTHISKQAATDYGLTVFPKGTVLMAMYGQGKTRGQVAYLNVPACTTQNAAAITPKERIDPLFLYFYFLGQYDRLRKHGIEGHISHLNLAYLKTFIVPVPPLATQKTIVTEIEAEQTLVAANRELIARFEKKIQATLARVWGEGADMRIR